MRIRETDRRTYVVLTAREAKEIGITIKKQLIVRGMEVRVYQPPPDAQPARTVYTIEEAVRLSELILAGARWCEYGRMHFLAVLPWKVPPL
jgi:hypothetical protein